MLKPTLAALLLLLTMLATFVPRQLMEPAAPAMPDALSLHLHQGIDPDLDVKP